MAKLPAKKTPTRASQKIAAETTFGESYVARLRAMVDELRRDPEIRVLQFVVNPPADAAALADVEKAIGATLSPDVRSFYEAADGIQLRWIHSRHSKLDPTKLHAEVPHLDVATIATGATMEHGLVNLLPAREAFGDWNGHTWFAGMTDDAVQRFEGKDVPQLQFHKALHIFDFYNFYRQAALYVAAGTHDEPAVLIGEDHGADWSDSEEPTHETFRAYLENLLATYGLVDERGSNAKRISIAKLVDGLDLKPAISSDGKAYLQRLKKGNKGAVELVSREELHRLGVRAEDAAAALRKQLSAETRWDVMSAMQRIGAFTEHDVPFLQKAASLGAAAALDALADLSVSSDAALDTLVGALDRELARIAKLVREWDEEHADCVAREMWRRGNRVASYAKLDALWAMTRLGTAAGRVMPVVLRTFEARVAGAEDYADLIEPPLQPWLLFFISAGVASRPAVPLLEKVERIAAQSRSDDSVSVNRLALAALVLADPSRAADQRAFFAARRDQDGKPTLPQCKAWNDEVAATLALWPLTDDETRRAALPALEPLVAQAVSYDMTDAATVARATQLIDLARALDPAVVASLLQRVGYKDDSPVVAYLNVLEGS